MGDRAVPGDDHDPIADTVAWMIEEGGLTGGINHDSVSDARVAVYDRVLQARVAADSNAGQALLLVSGDGLQSLVGVCPHENNPVQITAGLHHAPRADDAVLDGGMIHNTAGAQQGMIDLGAVDLGPWQVKRLRENRRG